MWYKVITDKEQLYKYTAVSHRI